MAATVLVLNGPNLDPLGVREARDLRQGDAGRYQAWLRRARQGHGLEVDFRQSRPEAQLIDWMHKARTPRRAS